MYFNAEIYKKAKCFNNIIFKYFIAEDMWDCDKEVFPYETNFLL